MRNRYLCVRLFLLVSHFTGIPFCGEKILLHISERSRMVLLFEYESKCLHGAWDYRWDVLCGDLSNGCQPVFTQISEKTKENSERLSQQARVGIEYDKSCLPALSAEPLGHWWGESRQNQVASILIVLKKKRKKMFDFY